MHRQVKYIKHIFHWSRLRNTTKKGMEYLRINKTMCVLLDLCKYS